MKTISIINTFTMCAIMVISVTSCSITRMVEPVWKPGVHIWDDRTLPLVVAQTQNSDNMWDDDIQAAIGEWNDAVDCDLFVYEKRAHINTDVLLFMNQSGELKKGHPKWLALTHVYGKNTGLPFSEIFFHNNLILHPWPAKVFEHELGHVLGLAHDNNLKTSIMNGFSVNYNLNSRIRDSDAKALNERYCR